MIDRTGRQGVGGTSTGRPRFEESRPPHERRAAALVCGLVLILSIGLGLTFTSTASASQSASLTLTSHENMYIDSNNPVIDGPRGAWLSFLVTNTGTETLNDLKVTFGGFANQINGVPTATVLFKNPTDMTPTINSLFPQDALHPNETMPVYFYVDYIGAINYGASLSPKKWTGLTAGYTVGVTSSTSGSTTLASYSGTVTITSSLSANAGGSDVSSTLGNGIWVGQVLSQTTLYKYGNNTDACFQPAGISGFNDASFRLVGNELINIAGYASGAGKAPTGIAIGDKDRLRWPTSNVPDSGTQFTMVYYWEVMDTSGATNVNPWANALSGQQYKYLSQQALTPLGQPAAAPLTVTKSVTPTWLPTSTSDGGLGAGIVKYTVTFHNTSDTVVHPITGTLQPTAIALSKITDVLPANVTIVDPTYTGTSSEITANSSRVPAVGAQNTVTWVANSSRHDARHYLIQPGADLTLVYTVNVSGCSAGAHANSVTGTVGNTTVGPATATFWIGSPHLTLTKTGTLDMTQVPPTNLANVNDHVDYTVTAVNDGQVPLGSVVLTDTMFPSQNMTLTSGDVNSNGLMDVGESWVYTYTYHLIAYDVDRGRVDNTATIDTDLTDPQSASATVTYTPTLAVVSSLSAHLVRDKVVVSWVTASEMGTAGFTLERLVPATNKWVAVNKSLVPALFESPNGGTYSVVDPIARANGALTYRLVEVETSGSTVVHGPYTVTAMRSLPAGQAYKEISRGNLMARVPKAAPHAGQSLAAAPGTGSSSTNVASPVADRLRIEVIGSGLYKIGAGDLVTGLRLTEKRARDLIRTNGLQLTTQGKAVAYLPSADGSALFFYGQALDSVYTDANVYWLKVGRGTPMIGEGAAGTAPVGSAVTSFVDSVHAEEDALDVPTLFHNAKDDIWLWDYLVAGYAPLMTKTFSLPAPDALGGAELAVNLQGLATTTKTDEHHVQVKLNGAVLGDTRWTGAVAHGAVFALPAGLLQEGENQVEITALLDSGISYSLVALDSMDLAYERSLDLVDGQLSFALQAPGPAQVGISNSSAAWIFDLADPRLPRLVRATSTGGGVGRSWLEFSGAEGRDYLVATAAGALRPRAVTAVVASTLRAARKGADYVVITSPALSGAATRLASYRARDGFKTLVVTTAEIYDEFNYGIASPLAIKSFISYATTTWRPVARFVLLAGEGSYDYKDNRGNGDSVVPSVLVDSAGGLVVSDVFLADNKGGDGVPETAIGRIPALTAAELDAVLAKIKAYEATKSPRQPTALFAADDPDDSGDFAADSNALATLVPRPVSVTKAYLSAANLAAVRSTLLSGFSRGTLLINYIGHGAVGQLAQESLLTTADLPALGANSLLPVVTAYTCVVGQYGLPSYDSLSEALVMRAKAGAIAVWAPTALEQNSDSARLGKLFVKNLFAGARTVRLGSVILTTLKSAAAQGLPVDVLQAYNLLGDPALKVRW